MLTAYKQAQLEDLKYNLRLIHDSESNEYTERQGWSNGNPAITALELLSLYLNDLDIQFYVEGIIRKLG